MVVVADVLYQWILTLLKLALGWYRQFTSIDRRKRDRQTYIFTSFLRLCRFVVKVGWSSCCHRKMFSLISSLFHSLVLFSASAVLHQNKCKAFKPSLWAKWILSFVNSCKLTQALWQIEVPIIFHMPGILYLFVSRWVLWEMPSQILQL